MSFALKNSLKEIRSHMVTLSVLLSWRMFLKLSSVQFNKLERIKRITVGIQMVSFNFEINFFIFQCQNQRRIINNENSYVRSYSALFLTKYANTKQRLRVVTSLPFKASK